MSPLDEIRARHQPTKGFDGPSGFCLCGEDWPCDAARLVALLSPEAVAEAICAPHKDHHEDSMLVCESSLALATALLDALTSRLER